MTTTSILVVMFTVVLTISTPIPVRSQANQDLVNAPACSSEQISEWSRVREKTLGVAGRDVLGHNVGSIGAKKTFFWWVW
jgi:hypothetical protein